MAGGGQVIVDVHAEAAAASAAFIRTKLREIGFARRIMPGGAVKTVFMPGEPKEPSAYATAIRTELGKYYISFYNKLDKITNEPEDDALWAMALILEDRYPNDIQNKLVKTCTELFNDDEYDVFIVKQR